MEHVLSELSTMTRPSWVALHGMPHSFVELDKALVHVGEGNGNPLQYFCLENPRDGGEPGGLPSMGLHRVGHD